VRVVLGPGAFGSTSSLRPIVRGLQARGIEAEAVSLPRGPAERAAAAFAALAADDVVVGGHSFGGRAASLAAAEHDFAGLLMFGFPLAGQAEARTAHFPRIRCPALVLNGEHDPMSPILQLRERAELLPRGRLISFPGAGHRLEGALDQALDAAAAFVRSLS
jgi:predicted alpha/beta-hydrolase family hydrolase